MIILGVNRTHKLNAEETFSAIYTLIQNDKEIDVLKITYPLFWLDVTRGSRFCKRVLSV